jgi:hypothetical protein
MEHGQYLDRNWLDFVGGYGGETCVTHYGMSHLDKNIIDKTIAAGLHMSLAKGISLYIALEAMGLAGDHSPNLHSFEVGHLSDIIPGARQYAGDPSKGDLGRTFNKSGIKNDDLRFVESRIWPHRDPQEPGQPKEPAGQYVQKFVEALALSLGLTRISPAVVSDTSRPLVVPGTRAAESRWHPILPHGFDRGRDFPPGFSRKRQAASLGVEHWATSLIDAVDRIGAAFR